MRLRAGILGVLVAVALGACGSANETRVTAGLLRRGAQSMDQATVRIRGTLVQGTAGEETRSRLEGSRDGAAGTSSLRSAVIDPDEGDMGVSELRTIAGETYLYLSGPDTPGRWVAMSDDSTYEQLRQAVPDYTDPFSLVARLRDVAEIETLGTETIDGVETTHCRIRIDPEALIARLPEPVREPARQGADEDDAEPFEVWVDSDGVVRRFVGTEPSRPQRIELEFYDFGADVDIQAPPEDEIVDMSSPEDVIEWFGSEGA